MNRLERLYAVSETIRSRHPSPVSATRLAEEFGVSRRTIERDLAALRSAGVPLYGEHGRRGGQRTAERIRRVVLSLSTPEVSALLIALGAAGEDMPFGDAGRLATRRLLDALPDATRVSVDELRTRIRTQADENPTVGRRIRHTLEEAVRRSVIVNIDYRDGHGNDTSRPVEAVGFYNGSEGWCLIGWCGLRNDRRLFRLDRVKSARLTKRPATRRDVDEALGWVPQKTAVP